MYETVGYSAIISIIIDIIIELIKYCRKSKCKLKMEYADSD